MKIKSTKLTALVMIMRDKLKTEALQLKNKADADHQALLNRHSAELQESKKIRHAAIIAANKMEREADMIQESLNEELELVVKENNASDAAWDIKSRGHLEAEIASWNLKVENE